MASIGSLTADLKLESAAFIRDLTKASQATANSTRAMQTSMNGLQKNFAAVGNSLKGFVAGFVTVGAVKQLATLGRTAIDTADDIGAAASKMGVGAEELQRLRFAAEQSDVSIDSLDAVLGMFQRNIATGKISAEGNNIADAFSKVIEQIRAAPTQVDKWKIAYTNFGKQAQSALALASTSTADFAANVKNAFVVSQQAVNIASELDNQIRAVGVAVATGFDTGFLEAFAGSVGTTQEQLVELNKAAFAVGNALGTAFRTAADAVQPLITAITTARDAWNLLPTFVQTGISTMLNPMGAFSTAVKVVAEETGGLKDETAGWVTTVTAANEPMGTATAKVHGLSDAQKELNQSISNGISLVHQTMGPLEEYNKKLADLTAAEKARKISAEEMGQAMVAAAASAITPWLDVASTIGGALGMMFKKSKTVAIVQAIINTAQAITRTFAQYGFTPIGIAAAAAQALAGAVQIAMIKKQKVTGAFSGGSFEVRGAGGVDNNLVAMNLTRGERVDVTPAGGNLERRAMVVSIPGFDPNKLYTGDGLRRLMDAIGVAIDDGANFGKHKAWA